MVQQTTPDSAVGLVRRSGVQPARDAATPLPVSPSPTRQAQLMLGSAAPGES
ncbi:hypothetical protein ACFVUW_00590 [Streptomyces xiamenensis]|uniref:hypothetical protein n=1 Tax=Streptomyces xiamenensis TaxID=408015 RepID=UPI0036E463C8